MTGVSTGSCRADLQSLRHRTATLFKAAPDSMRSFQQLSSSAAADGRLSGRVKELMALAIAIATRCEGCAIHHVEAALRRGAIREEVAETISVAIAMGGGPSVVYGATALAAFDELQS